MIPTIILTILIAVVVSAVIIKGIKNKKEGKHSCSCGGNCAACPMSCCGK